MKKTNDFIQEILMEVTLDERIESGILEMSNPEHVEVLAERLFDAGFDAGMVTELVNNLILREGKHPDRQAYNKEGWLVTFPSADYRNAAIQKGTHFQNDPTHGRGGMNTYYKKKGKTAHQSQQDVSTSEPVQGEQPTAPDTPVPAKAVAPAQQTAPAAGGVKVDPQSPAVPAKDEPTNTTPKPQPSGDSELPSAGSPETEPAAPASPESSAGGTVAATDSTPKPPAAPAPAPAAPSGPSIPELTKKFALSKNWKETPYGEWHGGEGEKVAVVGYDEQVVPVNHPDREALSVFIKRALPQT